MCHKLQGRHERDSEFLLKIITGNEIWVYGYDLQTKQQSLQWKDPPSPSPKKTSSLKCIEHTHWFFQHSRVVHYGFVPQRQTVNQHYYTDTFQCLYENVQQNGPENWNLGDYFLHHDYASAHSALSVCVNFSLKAT